MKFEYVHYIGEVYQTNNVLTGEVVAVKMESLDVQNLKLGHGWKVYKSFGAECGYKVMIMSLLGPSLEDLFHACHHKFTLKTVLMLADQLVSLVCSGLELPNFYHSRLMMVHWNLA